MRSFNPDCLCLACQNHEALLREAEEMKAAAILNGRPSVTDRLRELADLNLGSLEDMDLPLLRKRSRSRDRESRTSRSSRRESESRERRRGSKDSRRTKDGGRSRDKDGDGKKNLKDNLWTEFRADFLLSG